MPLLAADNIKIIRINKRVVSLGQWYANAVVERPDELGGAICIIATKCLSWHWAVVPYKFQVVRVTQATSTRLAVAPIS